MTQPDQSPETIIARLRALPGWWKFKQIASEAADEIERLQAEAARLTAERDKAVRAQNGNAYAAVVMAEERNALAVQLRAAHEQAFRAGYWRGRDDLAGGISRCAEQSAAYLASLDAQELNT